MICKFNAYGDWTEAICASLMIRSNFANHKFETQRNCIPQFRYAIRTFTYAICKLIHSYSPTSTFSLVSFDLTVHDRMGNKNDQPAHLQATTANQVMLRVAGGHNGRGGLLGRLCDLLLDDLYDTRLG